MLSSSWELYPVSREQGRHVNPNADYSEPGSKQLFDYVPDPLETINIVGTEKTGVEEARLAEALHEWLEATASYSRDSQTPGRTEAATAQ